jgi:hypothetical protein
MAAKTQSFRELVGAGEILTLPGIYDRFRAHLTRQMGCKRGAGLRQGKLVGGIGLGPGLERAVQKR